MTARDALLLGRVSNLPTVWSNTLAAIVLAGAVVPPLQALALGLAMSLFYTGGMYLNDAFDSAIDAVERPERPIPSGRVARSTVVGAGALQLAAGCALVALSGFYFEGQVRVAPLVAALALGGCIVLYDAFHKGNPLSPLIMALCRLGVYAAVGLACTAHPRPLLWLGGTALVSYLIGLTYAAKQENLARIGNLWPLAFLFGPFALVGSLGPSGLVSVGVLVGLLAWELYAFSLMVARSAPPKIGKAVAALIAGISLLDAAFMAAAGRPTLAGAGVVAFLLTLLFQRYVPGT